MRQKIMTSGLLLALCSIFINSKETPKEHSLALYSPINICFR